MAFIASAISGVAGAGASIFGSLTQANAQKQAAQTLLGGQTQAISAIQAMLGPAVSAIQPFASAGQAAIPSLEKLLLPGPNQTATLSQTPGFQFAKDWGLLGVSNQATTRGLGGNALAAGGQFAEGLASTTWSDIVSKLMGLYTGGAGAAGSLGGLYTGAGSNIAKIATGTAGEVAGTQVGGANALAGGAQGVASGVGNIGLSLALSKLLGGNQQGAWAPNSPNWGTPQPAVPWSPGVPT